MSGYHILARRSRQSIGAVERPLHIGWWIAGAVVLAGGYLALRNRDALTQTARRRVLLAGLAAGAPGCRTQLPSEPLRIAAPPPGTVYVDLGRSSPDLSDLPDMMVSPDLALAPDMVGLPDMVNGSDMLNVCCLAGEGCYLIDADGGLTKIDTGDAGEFSPPWCP